MLLFLMAFNVVIKILIKVLFEKEAIDELTIICNYKD